MGKGRFKELGLGSFFGDFVYARVVPRDHFLVKLNQLIDGEAFLPILLPASEGLGKEGRPPYSPVVIRKMLLLTYLYSLSERQSEEFVHLNLAAKEFVGLAVDDRGHLGERAPDHSTLGLFKRRLREAGRWDQFAAVGAAVLQQAQPAGMRLGEVQVVDSVHTLADVDNDADRRRQAEGKGPRDSQAQIVNKGKHPVTQADGEVVTQEIQYRGYKTHIRLNAETGLITTVHPTAGSAADNVQFPKLLAQDDAIGVQARIYSGDRA